MQPGKRHPEKHGQGCFSADSAAQGLKEEASELKMNTWAASGCHIKLRLEAKLGNREGGGEKAPSSSFESQEKGCSFLSPGPALWSPTHS